MAWAEVEQSAFADLPDAAAAEPLARIPAFLEDDFVRGWNVKWFVVHLGMGDIELLRNSFCNRMIGQQRANVTRLSTFGVNTASRLG